MFRTGADFTVRVLAMPLSMMAAPGASVLHERLYGRYKFTGKVEGCCDGNVPPTVEIRSAGIAG